MNGWTALSFRFHRRARDEQRVFRAAPLGGNSALHPVAASNKAPNIQIRPVADIFDLSHTAVRASFHEVGVICIGPSEIMGTFARCISFLTPEGNAVKDFRSAIWRFCPLSPGTPGERTGVRGFRKLCKARTHHARCGLGNLLRRRRVCAVCESPSPQPSPPGRGGNTRSGELNSLPKIVHGVARRGREKSAYYAARLCPCRCASSFKMNPAVWAHAPGRATCARRAVNS